MDFVYIGYIKRINMKQPIKIVFIFILNISRHGMEIINKRIYKKKFKKMNE